MYTNVDVDVSGMNTLQEKSRNMSNLLTDNRVCTCQIMQQNVCI